jgi:hypothetical protein
VDANPAALHLTALFGERFVSSHLRIGALIEAVRDLPNATAEIGRSGDPAADDRALRGSCAFLERDTVLPAAPPPPLHVLVSPMRALLRPGVRVAVADFPARDVELTVLADLDRHDFEPVAAGVPIGWFSNGGWPLELRDAEIGTARTSTSGSSAAASSRGGASCRSGSRRTRPSREATTSSTS